MLFGTINSPEFSVEVSDYIGVPFVVWQWNYTAPGPFVLIAPVTRLASADTYGDQPYALLIKWRSGLRVARYRLTPGGDIAGNDYAGEQVQRNFSLEFWNLQNLSVPVVENIVSSAGFSLAALGFCGELDPSDDTTPNWLSNSKLSFIPEPNLGCH